MTNTSKQAKAERGGYAMLCTEHELEIIEKLIAERAASVAQAEQQLHDKWMKIFHNMSSSHFGDYTAEAIANTYRVCAEELNTLLRSKATK